jgi:hypothetical protein
VVNDVLLPGSWRSPGVGKQWAATQLQWMLVRLDHMVCTMHHATDANGYWYECGVQHGSFNSLILFFPADLRSAVGVVVGHHNILAAACSEHCMQRVCIVCSVLAACQDPAATELLPHHLDVFALLVTCYVRSCHGRLHSGGLCVECTTATSCQYAASGKWLWFDAGKKHL